MKRLSLSPLKLAGRGNPVETDEQLKGLYPDANELERRLAKANAYQNPQFESFSLFLFSSSFRSLLCVFFMLAFEGIPRRLVVRRGTVWVIKTER